MLRDDIPLLLAKYNERKPVLAHNCELFNIYEGDLLTYVLADLAKQFSKEAFEKVRHRAAPINILIRIIQKLSQLYANPPVRKAVTEDGRVVEADQDLVAWYERRLDMNTVMGQGNEFFNLFKTCFVEPFIDPKNEYRPGLRVVPSDRFFVCGTDEVNPTRPTHVVKIMGQMMRYASVKNVQGRKSEPESYTATVLYAYTDQEFLAFDDRGEIVTEVMSRPEIAQYGGANPYGKIPGVYINKSRHQINPVPDTDTLAMTKIIPILLSDMNFATMFQAFSVLYGIDVEATNLVLSPNAFWSLKSDPNTKTEPKIGVIKPEVDSDKVVSLVKTELAMWMQSRGIKPGKMGEVGVEDAASGIAKAIDAVDTSEERTKQVPYFVTAEADLWDLIMFHMHPVWSANPQYAQAGTSFAAGTRVVTRFSEQKALVDASQLLDDQIKKINAGLESRKGALKVMNPDMSDTEIAEKLGEIDEGNTVEVLEPQPEGTE